MALPIAAGMLFQTLYFLIDLYFVAHLGDAAIAGVSAAGNIMFSLIDDTGANRFGAEGGQALLEHAVGGMQALLAESMAIFAPSFSAYRRYRPGAFVASAGNWGENSRAAAFRMPPSSPAARRIEHRVAAADASPHLVMACLLAGLHHGITRKLAPQAEITGLPSDIYTALGRFAGGALGCYFPAQFPALFTALKRGETADVVAAVSPSEFAWYL